MMKTFMEHIKDHVLTNPDRVVLADEKGEYTYQQIWDFSSRVYAYLMRERIGREDVVLVHLPRGAEAIMAMLAVFRIGAAVVVLEDWGTNDWSRFVEHDVAPRLIIRSDTLLTIRSMQPKDGYQTPNLHDLAYIAYTTGTTGQSKGVMHEYGTLQRMLDCSGVQDEIYNMRDDRTAMITTLHTSLPTLFVYLALGTYMYIVPHDVFDDPDRFHHLLLDQRITYTYLSPVYLHKYGMLSSPYLRYISVGFEPINAIYSDKITVFNDYGMREAGGAVCEFVIDKPYDITPIGQPLPPYTLSILDENDQPVKDGELGEICVSNSYCRGYLHLPELTAEHFRNGLYYTHDLGKRLPDGNYIMYGRINDAYPTPHGLIIALEIEVAARKVMGQPTAYVKIFPTDADPVICLYTDFPIDFQRVQQALRNELPAYKVPTHHIQVDHFEYNNGKAIRVHLKNPIA